MPEYSPDFSKEVDGILQSNSGLADMFDRAEKNPAKIAISCISCHEPSIQARELANEFGIAKVDFVGPEDGTESEKTDYANNLADTLRQRQENKIDKIHFQIEKLRSETHNKDTVQKENDLVNKLIQAKGKLESHNFRAETESKLFGDYGPVWLAVLRAYAGEYQGVVGGGDCPSAEFIKALLSGTSKNLGRLNSTYVLSGTKPEGMSSNDIIKHGNSRITENRVLAITDPALEPAPSIEQRAAAAFSTARVLQTLFPEVGARIAFASYSTGPSGKGPLVEKDRSAYKTFTETHPDSYPAYGPIQFDAATNEQTAKNKLSSFIRSLEQGKISQEEVDAYESIAGMASIISVQNLEVGNILVKALHAAWELSVEMGPLILSDSGNIGSVDNPLVASDLSRGEKSRSILSTLAALSILAESNQVK